MNAVMPSNAVLGRQSLAYSDRSLRRLYGAALVRIFCGPLCAADATFKWLPGFIHGYLNPATVPHR
jgi:hypothetical protein